MQNDAHVTDAKDGRTQKAGRRLLSAALALALLLALFAAAPGSAASADTGDQAKEWRDIVDVLAGEGYTIALRADGRVLFAGDADSEAGQRIARWEHIVRLDRQGWGDYIIGYREDGGVRLDSLQDWELYRYTDFWKDEDFTAWTDVKQLIVEDCFCLGLTNKGTVLTLCTEPDYLPAMRVIASWTGVQQLATDGFALVAGLKADGSVLTAALTEENLEMKRYWDEQCASKDVRELTTCGWGLLALRKNGTVIGMYDDQKWANIESLYVASDSMFGLRKDGTVAAGIEMGDPRIREVSTWTNIAALGFDCTGWARYVPVGLCRNGTIRAVTRDYDDKSPYGAWNFTGWSDVVKLYSGTNFTIGIRSDHTVLVTGGEFGALDYLDEIARWTDIQAIYAAASDSEEDHIVGLKTDGTLVAAGDNSRGQCQVSR